ncbi:MAG: PKD domain-containing protein, partial [Chitinophagia bacterium]|nr:PKD domain-containing protein [Chitinophagia bacterium]
RNKIKSFLDMKSKLFYLILLTFWASLSYGQITISRDSFACGVDSVVLHASITGSTPTSAGITADDGYSGVIGIGFTFIYYGGSYSNCIIGSNGVVNFNTSSAGAYCPWPISAALAGNSSVYNCICGPWCDIYIPAGGSIVYATVGTSPYRKFTVSWCATRMYSCTTQWTTSQIILYETTNLVEVHCGHKTICSWNGGRAIIGVQNSSGSASTAAPSRDWTPSWSATNEAWRFTPSSTSSSATYSVASISYAPIPYASSAIYWYDSATMRYLGTGATWRDTATVPRTYAAAALGCGDTTFAYIRVDNSATAGGGGRGLHITSYSTTRPSVCGICDGTVSLVGITPHEIDTIFYSFNGVRQPLRIDSAMADSTITIRGLCAGRYDYFYVKVGHCPSNAVGPFNINNPPFAVSSITHTNPSVCGANDASFTLFGLVAGYTDTVYYRKNGVPQTPVIATVTSGGTITITGLGAGAYTNIVVKMNDCTTSPVAVTITDPPFGISGLSFNDASCSACDGVITLRGLTPGQRITINMRFGGVPMPPYTTTSSASGTIVLTNLCPGVYTNIIATLNTCNSSPVGPVTISPPPLIPIAHVAHTQPTECGACDGTITIKGTPPGVIDTVFYTKNGIPQTPIITSSAPDSVLVLYNLCEGDYNNFFIKSGPCPTTTLRTSIRLTDPRMYPGFSQVTRLGCKADTVIFTNSSRAVGRLWYLWYFGDGRTDTSTNPVHIYTAQNNYHVTLIITNHHCIDSATTDLNLVHPIKAIFNPLDTLICQGSSVKFRNSSIGSLLSYKWDLGDGSAPTTTVNPTHIYSNTGKYKVQLIATNGIPCDDTATTYVQVDSSTQMSIHITDTVICKGTYITLSSKYTNIGFLHNVWDLGNGDSVIDVNPYTYGYFVPGLYNVSNTARYRVCPPVTVTRKVNVIDAPDLDLGPDKTICPGNEVIALSDTKNATTPGAHWRWNTGTTASSIQVTAPGTYYATVEINNCTATDSVHIRQDCYMTLPNIFSPNHDGVNDYLYPRSLISKGLVKFSMRIFNRWGQLIFETTNIDGKGWDGRFNGELQPQGVYMYVIEGTFRDGTTEHHNGNVTLVR